MRNTKKNIAIIWGGYSSEKDVSKKSVESIYSFIDKEKYNAFKIEISDDIWKAEYKENIYIIDKKDFSFDTHEGKIKIDFAYITIHGTPGEDGILQGYLEMINIPYSSCDVLTSSITFNKYMCNKLLKSFNIDVANSIVLKKEDSYNTKDIIEELGLPLFVKPNAGGSSINTTKISNKEELEKAIIHSIKNNYDLIIESFIDGIEVTCGCYKTNKGTTILPITEIISKNVFFDYNAKYNGESEEITPANISADMTKKIGDITKKIYQILNCRGIIRIDYIISKNNPILLEINTTPGMTNTSFIPQQISAAGLCLKNVLSDIIEYEYNVYKKPI